MEDTKKKRKPERTIRHQIGIAARKLNDRSGVDPAVSRFVAAFTNLEDTSAKHLLPNALTVAIRNAFEGSDLEVWTEVKFEVQCGESTDSNIKKSLDFMVTFRAGCTNCRAVAIEVKTTMEFNPLAAALMEFAMLTEQPSVRLQPSGDRQPFCVSSDQLRCLTLSCYDNQTVARLLPLMERQLWPNKQRRIFHHSLFSKTETQNKESTCGIAEFLDDIREWCNREPSEKRP